MLLCARAPHHKRNLAPRNGVNKKRIRSVRLAALLAIVIGFLATAPANGATVVFADTFEDGSVSDWIKSTNFAGTSAITASAKAHSGAFGLETYLEVPPPSGTNLFVRASHGFVAPVTATYPLDLWARSTICSGCVISYDVILDGASLARTSVSTYQQRSFILNGLSAGAHTLTLGMFTTVAHTGHFFAAFDDVSISTVVAVPEPAGYLMLLAGLGFIAGMARQRASAV